ncbi:MAG: catechol 2,3-dioxygenase-like lactoylglutathione lyase family enzyme [Gammaproteobacteria bacterium]|jgi:catechol 2,3-dioxygenase-like lactoylglutathione lyase family enzyme
MRVSLDHAHIFASDCRATVEFFQNMFAATVVWDEVVAGARVVRVRVGDAFIEVYDQHLRAPRGGAFHHLDLETDDLDGLIREMAVRGYEFRNEIRETPTFKYVMIAAPDDLLIELFECLEPERWGIRQDVQ